MDMCKECARREVKYTTRQLCRACYNRDRKRGTLPNFTGGNLQCSLEGCTKLHVARGYCELHYRQWKRIGTTRTPEQTHEIHVTTGQRNRALLTEAQRSAMVAKGNHTRKLKRLGLLDV